MDTDSFILSVKTPDITPYMKKNAEFFDCSAYSQNHQLYSETNKKIPGKFKDEMGDSHLSEIIFFVSKSIHTQEVS